MPVDVITENGETAKEKKMRIKKEKEGYQQDVNRLVESLEVRMLDFFVAREWENFFVWALSSLEWSLLKYLLTVSFHLFLAGKNRKLSEVPVSS